MHAFDPFSAFFGVVCGFSWTATYIVAVIRGFRDKTYSIPLPAIIANAIWESLYSTVFRDHSPVGPYIPAVWLSIDMVIIFQAIYYRWREFPSTGNGAFFFIVFAGLVTCFGILYYAKIEDVRYVTRAFPQELMSSVLFIRMLIARNDSRGQSMYIGVLKMLGNAGFIGVVAFPIATLSGFDAVTFLAILFFDFLYLVLLNRKFQQFGIKAWSRL